MSKTQQLTTSRRAIVREGEGVALDVTTHQVNLSGQTVALTAIDASKAPVPDRKYVADYVAVDESKRGFRLIFGQRRLKLADEKLELRSMLVIHMTPQAVDQFLTSFRKTKSPTYEEIIEKLGLEVPVLEAIPDEPLQTVALSANVILAAMAGEDACLDLYAASAFSQAAVEHGAKLSVDPVVRISLFSGSLVALFRDLKKRRPEPDKELDEVMS